MRGFPESARFGRLGRRFQGSQQLVAGASKTEAGDDLAPELPPIELLAQEHNHGESGPHPSGGCVAKKVRLTASRLPTDQECWAGREFGRPAVQELVQGV